MKTEEERMEFARQRLIEKLDRVGNWFLDIADYLDDGGPTGAIEIKSALECLQDIHDDIDSIQRVSRALAKAGG